MSLLKQAYLSFAQTRSSRSSGSMAYLRKGLPVTLRSRGRDTDLSFSFLHTVMVIAGGQCQLQMSHCSKITISLDIVQPGVLMVLLTVRVGVSLILLPTLGPFYSSWPFFSSHDMRVCAQFYYNLLCHDIIGLPALF